MPEYKAESAGTQSCNTVQRRQRTSRVFVECWMDWRFYPPDDVPADMTFLRNSVPELVQYFDATYVTESLQHINWAGGGRRVILCLRRNPPLFPADKWNFYEATLLTGVCTNNACESWNNRFRQLVGQAHPSVWKAMESLQLDQAMTSMALVPFARGQPPAKRVHHETVRHQERFLLVINSLLSAGGNVRLPPRTKRFHT